MQENSEQVNDQQPAAAPDDSPRETGNHGSDGDVEIRNPDAYAKAQAEKAERFASKYQEASSELEELRAWKAEQESEAEKRRRQKQKEAGKFEELEKEYLQRIEAKDQALSEYQSRVKSRLQSSHIEAALAATGIEDEDIRTVLRDHLAGMESEFDPETLEFKAAYTERAKELAAKLQPQESPPKRITGTPNLESSPSSTQTWERGSRFNGLSDKIRKR